MKSGVVRILAGFHLCVLVLVALPTEAEQGKAPSPAAQTPENASPITTAGKVNAQYPDKVSLAVTATGGVSLGAYQAGYLYYLTEFTKRNPSLVDLRLVTGASAGTINALLAVMAMGRAPLSEPEESLLYRLWTGIRYDELLDVENAPPQALSSRALLERLADDIENEWNKGFDEGLDMVVGVSTTRLKTRKVEINKGLSIPKLEEKFVFRIQGRGKGRMPAVSNYVDRRFGLVQPLLPFTDTSGRSAGRGDPNFAIIRQILFASTSVPIVFLPQEITYCMTTPNRIGNKALGTPEECPAPVYKDLFVDGAIADRGPLRLAHRIARSGLLSGDADKSVWRTEPDLSHPHIPDNLLFLYVDPRTPSYPAEPEDEEQLLEQATRLFRTTGLLFKGLFTSVREKEFYTLLEEYPEVRQRIQMATHDYPTVSGQMANFFGFFDREFRRFDFYIGMYDARGFVKYKLMPKIRRMLKDRNIEAVLPDPDPLASPKTGYARSWRPYYCLRAELDGEARLKEACHTDALRDFRILMQTTLDRLYDHCSRLEYDDTIDNWHCKLAMAGRPPPRVWPNGGADDNAWRQRDEDENSFEYTMRLLEMYKFHFKDLGLDRDDGSLAMSHIREELLQYIDTFAKKLRLGERMAVRLLGKPAINFFVYAPPAAIFYVVVGTGSELALSATGGRFKWFRFNAALQIQGFNLFLTEKANALALTPYVGLEFEPLPLSVPLLQTRVGARVGYQFSTEDRFLTGRCDSDRFKRDSIRCSAPVMQTFLAFTFYERIRFQFGLDWFPRWLPPMSRFNKHLWNGLIEVGWQWISPF